MKLLKLKIITACLFFMTAFGYTQNPTNTSNHKTGKSAITGEDLPGLKSGADPRKPTPILAGHSRKKGRPVVFVIGDSTAKNGKDDGSNGQWGWGHFLWESFDTTRVSVENHALGGRSSRTYITEGLWAKVLAGVQQGDYVLIQFGHNDAGPLNTGRSGASLKGNGDADTTVVMEATGKEEIIHSFGWYMRRYARDTKAKGATPVLLSHIPRNMFTSKDSTAVIRNTSGFGKWTKDAAQMENVPYIDVNSIIAGKLDRMGKDSIRLMYHGDHTHTSITGAMLNAKAVAEGINGLKNCDLKKLLKK